MRRCQRYNLRDVRLEYMRIAPHKKRVDSLLLHCGERGGDVFRLADFNRLERDAERICGSTQTREELRILIVHHLPIHQDAYPLEARYCTLQELQLLAAQVIHRDRETRRVSSRSRQARHEALLHGIVAGGHDDGDGTRRRLCCAYALRRARDNDVDGEVDELCRQCRQPRDIALCVPVFDDDALPGQPSELA